MRADFRWLFALALLVTGCPNEDRAQEHDLCAYGYGRPFGSNQPEPKPCDTGLTCCRTNIDSAGHCEHSPPAKCVR